MVALAVTPQEIKARLDCRDLAESRYCLKCASRTGKGHLFHRPGEVEHKPSFDVFQDGYKDLATGEHGDTFDFIRLVERVDFKGALEIGAALAGATPGNPAPPHLVRPAPKPPEAAAPWLTQAWQQAATAAQTASENRVDGPVSVALAFAAQGYSVIPVKNTRSKNGRIPLVKWTPYRDLRPTADDLRQWWQTWPDANPVIVTGALSSLIALDVDGPEGLAWLVSQGLPPTFTVWRGASGRYHFWFKHPGFKVSNKTLYSQVEVKGDGGLIPCPGALHWTGAPYVVSRDLPLAECPSWLIELLKPAAHPAPIYVPSPDDEALITFAVDALSPARSDNREDWLAVGMALHSAGEQYRALWHAFSARSEKYSPRNADQTWNSFKRSGITVATLFQMANEDTPGWRPSRPMLPTTHHNISQERAELPAIWPSVYPAALERLVFAHYPRAGKQVNKVLRALAETGADTWYTVAELSEKSGLSRKTIERGLASLGAILDRMTGVFSSQERGSDQATSNTIGQSVQNTTAPGRKPDRFRLPAYPVFVERLIEYKVRPALEQKRQPAKITRALARTLDPSTTPAQLAAANAPIEAALSEAERTQEAKTERQIEAKIAQVRRALCDTRGAPLPDGWQTDYTGAVIERHDATRIDVQESRAQTAALLGVSESTIYRTELRRGFYREENLTPELVGAPARLPEQTYAFDKQGFPVKAVVTRAGQVVNTLDYRREETPDRVRAAMAVPGTETVIYYQGASTIRRMSDEQRAAYEAERAEKKERAQRRAALKPKPKPKPAPKLPAYDGPDYDPALAPALVIDRLKTYHGYRDSSEGAVTLRGEVYADKPFMALSGPELMRLTRFEKLPTMADDDLMNEILPDEPPPVVQPEPPKPARVHVSFAAFNAGTGGIEVTCA